MTKALMSTLGAKIRVSLIKCISILLIINNLIHDACAITVFICLRMHIFSYRISRVLFDLTIRKLNVISQSIKEGVRVMRTRCIIVSVFSLTRNFFFLENLLLIQIQLCMTLLKQKYFTIDTVRI